MTSNSKSCPSIGDSWLMVYRCYVGPVRSPNKVWWCLKGPSKDTWAVRTVCFSLTSGNHPLKPWEVRATHVAAEWLQWWQYPTCVYFCEDEGDLYIQVLYPTEGSLKASPIVAALHAGWMDLSPVVLHEEQRISIIISIIFPSMIPVNGHNYLCKWIFLQFVFLQFK